MATKNKEKEAAAAQVAQTTEQQAAQEAPATVTDAPAEATVTEAAPASGKEEKKTKSAVSVLEKAGKAAIARHGFKEVFVTSDGQVFPLFSDAKNHASDLSNKEIIKVKK